MIKIELFKNGNKVLEKEGTRNGNVFSFDNITYELDTFTLTREDANFKFMLDFNSGIATINLKKEGHTLDLDLSNIKKEISDNKHKIYYNIESEEVIDNILEITF